MKSLLQKPKWRTLLFVFFVLGFYFTRTRAADPIHDFQFLGDYGYMAAGKSGVIVLTFSDPENPTEVAAYDTLGYANAIQVEDDHVYIADDSNGLQILSRKKLLEHDSVDLELANYKTPGSALDVAVKGNFAYIVDSKEDIVIVNIKNFPITPEKGVIQDVPGKAVRIKIYGDRAYVTNNKDQLLIYTLDDPQTFETPDIYDAGDQINNFLIDGEFAYLAADSKGLLVLNIKTPSEIKEEGKFDGVKNALDVSLQGNYAYVASGGKGFFVLDVTEFSTITQVGHESSLANAYLVAVKDAYVYVADDLDGLKAFHSPMLFEFTVQEEASNLGSFETVIVKDDYAYIAAGETGLRVVNVEDPSAPVGIYYDDEIEGYATALDSKGDDIYMLYRKKGLRVFTVSGTPGAPKNAGIEKDTPGEANDLMIKDEFVYIADGSMGLQIIDLTEYAYPEIYSEDTPGNALGVFILEEYAYIADGGQGLQIILVSDPEKPTLIQSVDTPGEASAVFVSKMKNSSGEERIYALVADGGGGLYIVDVTDPKKPVAVTTYDVKSYVSDVIVREKTAYLAEREDGLILLDVSEIAKPALIGNQSTPGDALRIFLHGDLGYVADGDRGLRVVDFEDKDDLKEIGFFDVPKKVTVIVAQDPNGYMVDGEDGMWVMDLSTPKNPYPAAFYSTPGKAKSITVDGENVYITDGPSGLQVVDVSVPFAPAEAGSYEEIDDAISVAVEGSYAYVGSAGDKMHILKKTDLANINEVAVYETKGEPKDIDVFEGYAYIAEGESGLEVVNVKDAEKPTSALMSQNLDLTDTQAVLVLGYRDHLFVADGKNGLKVFDVDGPATPEQVFHFETQSEDGIAKSVTIEGDYAFLAVENEGLYQFYILDLSNITKVGSEELEQAQSIAAISSPAGDKKIKRFYNYIAVGDQGLQTYEVAGEAAIQATGIYETVGEATLSQVMRSVFTRLITSFSENPVPIPDKVWIRIAYMAFGVIVFLFLSALWLILFAQFVLPVQTFKDGGKATARLYQSLWGNDGPAVFAKDGGLVARAGELERLGRGVARVDLNSAIVLERRALFQPKWRRYYKRIVKQEQRRGNTIPRARVEGPGVVFIKPYETIRGVADLQSQFRIRPGVKAYTRDGIEVNNPVWILFTLGQPPVVLDVAYVGARKAENLRVIYLDDDWISTGDQQKRKGKLVKEFVDELDKSDKEEIHLFIQKNILTKYFLWVKKLALEIDLDGDSREIIEHFVDRIKLLASRFDLGGQKDISKFFEDVSGFVDLSEKNGVIDIPIIQWFTYHVGVRADYYAIDGMTAFHQFMYQLKLDQYIQELQSMQFPKELVEYAQQRMDQFIKHQKGNDANREFILNALRVQIIINREINRDLENLSDDEVDGIKKEELIAFMEKIASITGELIRTDYPFIELYGNVAKLYDCVSKMNRMASQITIEEEWKFPNMMDLYKIRSFVGNIQKKLVDQEKACESEFTRYIDLVKIYDYVEFVRQQLDDYRMLQSEDEDHQDLLACIDHIQQKAANLDQIINPEYQRPVEKLKKLVNGLEGKDSSEVYFFGKKVDEIGQKTKSADIIVVRSFLRKSQQQIHQVRNHISHFSALVSSGVVNGEVQEYQEQITEIQAQLDVCQIPARLLFKAPPKQIKVGPYLFDRKRVLAAVYSEALDLDRAEGESEHMPWTNLPVHVAAQTFRDMVAREQYDYLYQPKDPHKFNMPKLKGNFSRAVRNQGVLAFRFVDHVDGLPLEEGDELAQGQLQFYEKRELKNPKVLRARGIKVIASGFPDLFPVSAGVPSHQLDYWSAPWQRDSTEIRSQHQLQAVRVINQARAQSQREMAYNLARILQSSHSDEALAMRVFQALEAAASDEDIRQFLPRDTMHLLRSFRQWFIDRGSDDIDLPDPFNLPDGDTPLLDQDD